MAALGRGMQIGGGIVKRTFNNGGRHMRSGERLTAEEILGWPTANRQALIDKKFIEVWPKGDVSHPLGSVEPAGRHLVSLGSGRFNVVEGRVVNTEPLTRSQAMALAGIEPVRPKKKPQKSRRH